MIDALVFDFDGVIVDTETPDYASWQEVFGSYGVELDRSLWSRFIGGSARTFDACGHLEKLARVRVDRDAVRRRRRQRYLSLVEANPVLPGVFGYIMEAKEQGLKLGVASSSSRAWVEGHLEKRDLLKHFDSIKCADDVSNVKPHPEVYLAVVAHLGTRPANTLAIEDSANGVTAAKAAGLVCVVVPNDMTRDLPVSHADFRLNALSDAPLSALVSTVSQQAPQGEIP